MSIIGAITIVLVSVGIIALVCVGCYVLATFRAAIPVTVAPTQGWLFS